MNWERYNEWEEKQHVVRAYRNNNWIKEVVYNNNEDVYKVCNRPDCTKQIDTVTLIEETDTRKDALGILNREIYENV